MTNQPMDIDFNELARLEKELKDWEDKINNNPNASDLDIQKMLKEMEQANSLLEGLANRVDDFNDKLYVILTEMDAEETSQATKIENTTQDQSEASNDKSAN